MAKEQRKGLSKEDKLASVRGAEAVDAAALAATDEMPADGERVGATKEEKGGGGLRMLILTNAIGGAEFEVPEKLVDYVEDRGVDDSLIFLKPTAFLIKRNSALARFYRSQGTTGARAPIAPPPGWTSADEAREDNRAKLGLNPLPKMGEGAHKPAKADEKEKPKNEGKV